MPNTSERLLDIDLKRVKKHFVAQGDEIDDLKNLLERIAVALYGHKSGPLRSNDPLFDPLSGVAAVTVRRHEDLPYLAAKMRELATRAVSLDAVGA